MGIHGLTSFIDNNPHLLKDRQLHDCRVVIDGNNFYHFLYYYCNVRFQFGGDYDIFQRKISMIFSMFRSCNVEVFVVLDGAYTVDGKKFKTTISRARDRVFAAKRIVHGQRGSLIPCLARQTFTQTLDKLGIQHVTCDFEADNQLVTLANQWNCPVISNDSDFYIFDLSGGFIPLDYIDFRPRRLPQSSGGAGDSAAFLPVQYYHVDEFIKCFQSLNRAVLPLFATMLGNDYVNARAFESFYQKKTPKCAARRYSASKKHQKIVSVLYWLEEKEDKEELVSQVLTFIRAERRQKVEKLVTDSMSGYADTQDFESFDLTKFLEGDRTAATQKTDCPTSLTGKCLPAWFVAACRCGEMPVFLLNAALLHRIILPTQVESISLPASFLASKAIREVAYGLLLGQEQPHDSQGTQQTTGQDSTQQLKPDSGPSQDFSSVDERKSTDLQLDAVTVSTEPNSSDQDVRMPSPVEKPGTETESETCESSTNAPGAKGSDAGIVEYTRHNMELWRIAVQPCVALPKFGHVPSMERVPTLSHRDRQAVLLETLGVSVDFVDGFEPALQLYMACLVFWVRTAAPGVTLHHLRGVVLSAVLLHVHKEIADRENDMIDKCVIENGSETEGSRHVHQSGSPNQNGTDSEPSATTTLKAAQQVPPPQLKAQRQSEAQRQPEVQSSDASKPARTTDTEREDSSVLSISGVCHSALDRVLGKVRDNLKKYYHDPPKISSKNSPQHETFHRSAQLQACLLDAVHLNCLLRRPVPTPQPAVLFNGTFVYAIARELQIRSNPDLFLSEMLVKGSALVALLEALVSRVAQEAGEGVLGRQASQGKKCCKSAKRKRKSREAASESRGGAADGVLLAGGAQAGEAVVASCDLTNRFGVLLLEEDS